MLFLVCVFGCGFVWGVFLVGFCVCVFFVFFVVVVCFFSGFFSIAKECMIGGVEQPKSSQ